MKDNGQSLVEYTLCAALVIGVSISGLLLLRENLSSLFVNMVRKPDSKTTLAVGKTPTQTQSLVLQAGKTAQKVAQALQENASSPDLAPDAQTVVVTAGGNGDTKAAADYVESLVRQAIANGELSPENADFDLKLANKGHEIANIQALLEQARSSANGNLSQYQNMLLSFGGQSYTPITLGNHLNDVISEYNDMRLLMMNDSKGLSKTLTEAVVREATLKIRKAGEATHNIAVTNSKAMAIGAAEHKGGEQSGITYAAETHQNSAIVCNAGEHVDQNNQCIK